MKLKDEVEVLVVGAGPVGLITALSLAKNGINVEVVDKAEGTATRNYACALHPASLELFDQVGVLPQILENGHRINQVAFYEGDQRREEWTLSELDQKHPFVVTFPQGRLEGLLQEQLLKAHDVHVHWNHRFSTMHPADSEIIATVDQLEETCKGYAFPGWEWVVKKTLETQASFLIGADGPNSHVRQVLNLKSDVLHPNLRVAVFEFQAEQETPDEMCLVLGQKAFSAFWPMTNGVCRWTFEMSGHESPDEFPTKETAGFNEEHPAEDREKIQRLQRLIRNRAPWFKSGIKKLEWSGEVIFPQRLTQSYGRGRCWLVGDAAHQTNPLASQSLNGGLLEGHELAHHLHAILRDNASLEVLNQHDQQKREAWTQLMKHKPELIAEASVPKWLRPYAKRLPSCLPALGQDLNQLLQRGGLQVA